MTQKLPGQIFGHPQAADSADPTPDTSRAPRQVPPFRRSFSLCCISVTQWLPADLPTCRISSSSQTYALEKAPQNHTHTTLLPNHVNRAPLII